MLKTSPSPASTQQSLCQIPTFVASLVRAGGIAGRVEPFGQETLVVFLGEAE
jgi:hypothetical protein